MTGFAERTALAASGRPRRRYLWTDAFAVCIYLELYRRTQDAGYLQIASNLVDQVHRILGRYSVTDARHGWISGLSEREGALHPTRGGLRIGKTLNERSPNQSFDESLEWERDGQYFHYLTKWMHALNQVSLVTRNPLYNLWAIELAKSAHTGFTYSPPVGPKRMHWKMSIDLSHPLVASMGLHDPLDGLITFEQLEATAAAFSQTPAAPNLITEIEEMSALCEGRCWATDDPLGIGGLLTDAHRLTQLIINAGVCDAGRLLPLLRDAETGLDALAAKAELNHAAEYRLAFRELGLSIGIHAIPNMGKLVGRHGASLANQLQLASRLAGLSRFLPLIAEIEGFWLEPANQRNHAWQEHIDINSVMLATSLMPEGFLNSLEDEGTRVRRP